MSTLVIYLFLWPVAMVCQDRYDTDFVNVTSRIHMEMCGQFKNENGNTQSSKRCCGYCDFDTECGNRATCCLPRYVIYHLAIRSCKATP